jgi:hypothetical protein
VESNKPAAKFGHIGFSDKVGYFLGYILTQPLAPRIGAAGFLPRQSDVHAIGPPLRGAGRLLAARSQTSLEDKPPDEHR